MARKLQEQENMKREVKKELIAQAKIIILPYVDVTHEGYKIKIEPDKESPVLCNIIFTNAGHKEIAVTDVWFNEDTGEILQWGSHYGRNRRRNYGTRTDRFN
jgi:hypothetical protein